MKTVLTLIAIATSSPAFAAHLTCEQLQAAVHNGNVAVQRISCSYPSFKSHLLATVRFFQATEEGETYSQTRERTDPICRDYDLNGTHLRSVDIDLGDNSFELFFSPNVSVFRGRRPIHAGIAVHDGSVTVDGEYCDVDLQPSEE
jgi:hypothetical protein